MATAKLNNLGFKVHTQKLDWADMVRRSWGPEFNEPDHGVYEWSNFRQFDSTDKGQTGIYNPFAFGNSLLGFSTAGAAGPQPFILNVSSMG